MSDEMFDELMSGVQEAKEKYASELGLPENLDMLLDKTLDLFEENKGTDFYDVLFKGKEIKLLLMGGYARNPIIEMYGNSKEVPEQRITKDIDFYSPEGNIIAAVLDLSLFHGNLGATYGLTHLTQMEVFNKIDGTDDFPGFNKLLEDTTNNDGFRVYKQRGDVSIVIPTPEIYIASKLFAKRNEPSRTKDFKDVQAVYVCLKDQPEIIKKIEDTVELFNLTGLYKEAISQKELNIF